MAQTYCIWIQLFQFPLVAQMANIKLKRIPNIYTITLATPEWSRILFSWYQLSSMDILSIVNLSWRTCPGSK